VISEGYSLFGNSLGCSIITSVGDLIGTDANPIDPKLARLQNNGGPTPTRALMLGSPAIDAGPPTDCPATDQRGVSRPRDGNGDGTARCDIGAYEVAPPTISAITNQTILENTATGTIPFTIGDADTALSSLTVTAVSSNPALVPNANIVLGGSGASRTISVTPAQTNALSAPTHQGSATITLQASDGSAITTTSFSVTVQPPPWLVLLYLSGDDPVLDKPTRDLLQALQNPQRWPSNPALRLVVLYDVRGDRDSRIYVRDPGGLTDMTAALLGKREPWLGFEPNKDLNTGDPATLSAFVRWARDVYAQPGVGATYTMLSIIDHGGGWAPDFDLGGPPQPSGGRVQAGGLRGMSNDSSSDYQALSTRDTAVALRNGLDPGQHLDLVFYDACLMGMLESAHEVRDYADFLVAGQNQLFAEYPYNDYLAPEHLNPNTKPRDLATTLVDRYNRVDLNGDPIDASRNPFTLAALDLRQLRDTTANNPAASVNALAAALLAGLPATPVPLDNPLRSTITRIYSATQKFDYDNSFALDPTEGYVDLADFAGRLRDSVDPSITAGMKAAADAVLASMEPVVVHQRSVSGEYRSQRSGRQRWDLARASGLSIFLPLGEQDWRPTRFTAPGQPACSEAQLDYYVDPEQLAFSQRPSPTAVVWADLLLRLKENTPIRAPNPCLDMRTALASDLLVAANQRPFYLPAPVELTRALYLPSVFR
jgi:hypothetical protein